jgi:hypothetical protein
MLEMLERSAAPVDPTVLGDPAAAEEIHRTILSEAATLGDLGPLEEEIEVAVLTLT